MTGSDTADKVSVLLDYAESLAMPTRDALDALAEKIFVRILEYGSGRVDPKTSWHINQGENVGKVFPSIAECLSYLAQNSYIAAEYFLAEREKRKCKDKP